MWFLSTRWLPLATALVVFTCSAVSAQTSNAPLPAVGVVVATKQDVTPSYEFVGRIEAVSRVALRARVTGFLREQRFSDGQTVNEGDILFIIEQEPFAAALRQAEADLAAAKAEAENATVALERAVELRANETVSQATVDDRTATKRVADASVLQREAALEKARITFSYTEVVAPISGRIGRTSVKPGNLVSPETGVLATIVNDNPAYVNFNVTDREALEVRRALADAGIAEVRNNQRVQIKLRLSDGSIYSETGRVDFRDVQVNPTTDTILFRGVIANPRGILADQQFVIVIVETATPKQLIVIPAATISFDQRGRFVLIIDDDGRVQERFITVGSEVAGGVAVTKGLEAGDRVIRDGIMKVRPGMQVEARPIAQAPGGK